MGWYDNPQSWIDHARKYLAFQDKDDLVRARDAVEDPEINWFLNEITITPGTKADRSQEMELIQKLENAGQQFSSDFLRLLLLEPAARIAQDCEKFPPEQKQEMIKFTFDCCETCKHISNTYCFPELEAIFQFSVGTGLFKIGIIKEAIERLGASVEIYQELDKSNPGIYTPDYALALNNFGIALRNHRSFYSAREVLEKAIPIYRGLVELDEIHLSDLARALHNLGNVYRDLRQFPECSMVLNEAKSIREQLTTNNTEQYMSQLENTKRLLAFSQVCHDPTPDNKAAYSKMEDVYIKLAESQAEESIAQAASLIFVANTYVVQHRELEAIAMFSKILEILNKQAKLGSYSAELYGGTLNNLGNLFVDLGDFLQAKKAFEEALAIFTNQAETEPEVYLYYVVGTAMNLGRVMDEMGLCEDALKQYRRAVEACEESTNNFNEIYLIRGGAEYSYLRLIGAYSAKDDADSMFRHLVALREPVRMPGVGELERVVGMLNTAPSRLKAANSTTLIIENLGQDETLVAVLGWEMKNPFKWELMKGLGDKHRAFWENFIEYHKLIRVLKNEYQTNDKMGAKEVEKKIQLAIDMMLGAVRDVCYMLPSWVQEYLCRDDGREIFISSATWSAFPFELLPYRGESDYLGLHHSLPRITGLSQAYWVGLTNQVFGNGDNKFLCFVNPTCDLPTTEIEASEIKQCLGGKFDFIEKNGAEATPETLSQLLQSPFAVFHYSGHGTVLGSDGSGDGGPRSFLSGEEALCLHGEENWTPFSASYVRYLKFESAPLIVLNSCLTGRTRLYGGIREDLAGTFIRQGAETVIASAIPVGAEIGMIFGGELYRQDDPEIQKAFFNARKKTEEIARGKNELYWICWAFFTLHGNPYARLPHVKST